MLCFSNGAQINKPKIVLPFFIFLATQSLSCSSILSNNPVPSSLSNFSKFPGKLSSSTATIFSACKHTPYQSDCESSLVSFKSTNDNIYSLPIKSHKDAFDLSVQFIIEKAHSARALAYSITLSERKFHAQFHGGDAIADCLELLDDTVDLLAKVTIRSSDDHGEDHGDDVHTWLSAALTNQQTCLESLQKYRIKEEKRVMEANSQSLSKSISNSLALYLASSTAEPYSNPRINGGGRRLLSGDFPRWVSAAERKLLEAPVGEIEAHAVVAEDGSGTHMTISEALTEARGGGGGGERSVIRVKAGTYHEYIKIPTKQKNVMLIGDGKGKTVIVGNRNYQDGWTTYDSATVGMCIKFLPSIFFFF